MDQRVFIYTRSNAGPAGTEAELVSDIRRTVEDRGDTVVATFVDDDRITGRGKYAGWNALVRKLDEVDEVVVAAAGDLPGRNVADLLKILGTFRDHHVGLYLYREEIDTGSTGFALLHLIEAYRSAKLSEAIRAGQAKARAAGRRIGRPEVPPLVRDQIIMALTQNAGIRPIARQYAVSPATVINIRRILKASSPAEAA